MEKEKDWAYGTSMCKSSTFACIYLLFSYMECSVEHVQMLIHAQTMKYVQMPCNCLDFQFRSKLTLLYSHMALLCLCLGEVQLKALHSITWGLFGGVNKESSLLNVQSSMQSSMSMMECLTS